MIVGRRRVRRSPAVRRRRSTRRIVVWPIAAATAASIAIAFVAFACRRHREIENVEDESNSNSIQQPIRIAARLADFRRRQIRAAFYTFRRVIELQQKIMKWNICVDNQH